MRGKGVTTNTPAAAFTKLIQTSHTANTELHAILKIIHLHLIVVLRTYPLAYLFSGLKICHWGRKWSLALVLCSTSPS